jgi:hypothetical protein
MTEEDFATLKLGNRVEFGQHPWLQRGVVTDMSGDIIKFEIDGGEQLYYSEYVKGNGRIVEEWTPKPVLSIDDLV